MTQPKRLTLIDGSGFIFRAFYAMPSLTNKEGTPVGAVYGFVNMMQKLLRDAQNNDLQDYIAVIFDAGRFTFRNEIYEQYKANRDEAPEELRPQFALVREATEALNLPAIDLAGVEADDLIASYTREAQAKGFDEVIIVSSDKDLMQLVDDRSGTHMFDAMKSKVIREAEVEEKFGVPPHKVRDVLALMGDSSDNIPGIYGIGPKTATQLIQHFGDLESLLNRAEEEVPQKKRRESLIEQADNARLSYVLVTLKDDCQLPVPIEDCFERPIDESRLRDFLQEMGFKKMEEKLGQTNDNVIPAQAEIQSNKTPASAVMTDIGESEYALLDETGLSEIIAKAEYEGRVAISVVESGIALAVEAGKAVYYPFSSDNSQPPVSGGDLFAFADEQQAPKAKLPKQLLELLKNPSVLKIGHAIKEDIKRLKCEISPVDDVTLLSYSIGAGLYAHEFDKIVLRELECGLTAEDTVLGKGKSKILWSAAAPEDVMPILSERADYALRIWHYLKPQLAHEQVATVYEKIERPLLSILASMENEGVKVDNAYLQTLSDEFKAHIAKLEQEVHELAGQEFLLSSPKQLGEVLFDSMGLPSGKKSKKTGQYSTGIEVLEDLAASGYDIARKILDWRHYEKLRGTYTDALANHIEADGRVHTILQQTVAATGRLSSTNPNLQNIPIRTDEGKRIRKAFICEEGYNLIAADYSQIELRLLAELADMAELKDAFRKGYDIHAATASQMFNIPIEEVDSEFRRRAKTINFGIIYGISAHGLSVRLGIERAAAARFIEAYFEHYPGIRTYMESKKHEAHENGYVKTLFGRKVHIKGIEDKNYNIRAFAERQAINAPLQGTAADIIKRAMLNLADEFSGNGNVRMLLQVHDELLFEIKEEFAEDVTAKVKSIMENAVHLSLPLTVETGIGKDWGEIH